MIEENFFVPRILLCGSREEFFVRVAQRPYELVGQVEFLLEKGEHELDLLLAGKFLLNDEPVDLPELPKLLASSIDFLVFNNYGKFKPLQGVFEQLGCPRSQVMTLREFNHLPLDNFYDTSLDIQLLTVLKNSSIKTLLDADAHFVKSGLFTKSPNDFTEIDCICREELLPIKENLFRHVYKNFSECNLRRYDAVLINEKSPTDFDKAFATFEHSTDIVITFARNNSPLLAHIQNNADNFKKLKGFQSSAGTWIFCQRRRPPDDFAMYVVTHKKLPPEHVQGLPEGYKVIHAGKILGDDLGYLGDDTGDNISELNPFLCEVTALYWIWKNTSHSVIGLSHYRRFFVADEKNFLTAQETLDLLNDYDIIVGPLWLNYATTAEILRHDICDNEVTPLAENIIRKNLLRAQPNYLDAFNLKMNSPTCYYCQMFIARRPVFDAYCRWLFSFMIDATEEILNTTRLSTLSTEERRLPAHFAERMLTVWLTKNHLRIKEIGVTQVPGL